MNSSHDKQIIIQCGGQPSPAVRLAVQAGSRQVRYPELRIGWGVPRLADMAISRRC
ncbi:hypothetical protein NXW50_05280 [Bacteroides thetaiotaomicron]|nr:hypothetical protein [Bacteroides thetaiotaomicron]MCS2277650.1 hypothetical protein [Bacteroides thetaiotaomicron]